MCQLPQHTRGADAHGVWGIGISSKRLGLCGVKYQGNQRDNDSNLLQQSPAIGQLHTGLSVSQQPAGDYFSQAFLTSLHSSDLCPAGNGQALAASSACLGILRVARPREPVAMLAARCWSCKAPSKTGCGVAARCMSCLGPCCACSSGLLASSLFPRPPGLWAAL